MLSVSSWRIGQTRSWSSLLSVRKPEVIDICVLMFVLMWIFAGTDRWYPPQDIPKHTR